VDDCVDLVDDVLKRRKRTFRPQGRRHEGAVLDDFAEYLDEHVEVHRVHFG
jgi:hypothetical protein